MYHETADPDAIISKLQTVIASKHSIKDLGTKKAFLDNHVQNGTLWNFAEIKTNRQEYKQKHSQSDNEQSINIVIDKTDWGYIIGEIEILVKNETEVEAAASKIDVLADKLCLTKVQEGKVLDYIKQHRPKAYNVVRHRHGMKIK